MNTSPSSGNSKPAISRSVVVLPQPEGPSREKNEPRGMSRVRSFTATVSLKRLVTRASRRSTADEVSVTRSGMRLDHVVQFACGGRGLDQQQGEFELQQQLRRPALYRELPRRDGIAGDRREGRGEAGPVRAGIHLADARPPQPLPPPRPAPRQDARPT